MLTAPLDHDRDAGRRPKRFLRWIAILLSILVILFCTVVVLVRSQWFHRHVMAMVIADLQQATGGRTEIRNYHIHWYGLAMDLDDVLIHGTESDPNLALVHADRITVG